MTLKLRTKVAFPPTVQGGSGVTVSKSNGIWTIAADVGSISSQVGQNLVLDEDDMASNSATKAPSQQSAKAYADQRGLLYDSVAAAAAAHVPVVANYIRTASYYGDDNGGGALYARAASEPSHQGKIQSADGAWWEIAESQLNVLQFGAKGDDSTDDRAAFNNAISAAGITGRRTVRAPYPTSGYRITSGSINFTTSGVRLVGDSRYTPITFANGSSDCFNFDGSAAAIYACSVERFRIQHSAKTGGATVKAYKVNQSKLRDCSMSGAWNGFDLKTINEFTIDDVNAASFNGQFAVKFWSLSDGTERSDVLRIIRSAFNCAGVVKGIIWDGYAHTLQLPGASFISPTIGLQVLNTGNSASYFPQIVEQSQGFVVDGATSKAVEINAGLDFNLSHATLRCATAAAGPVIEVLPDSSYSITRLVTLVGARVTGGQGKIISIGARDFKIVSCTIADGANAGSASAEAVEVTATAKDGLIDLNRFNYYGATVNFSYGVTIADGAVRVTVGPNNDFDGVVTGKVLNNATSTTVDVLSVGPYVVPLHANHGGGVTWGSMPASASYFTGSTRGVIKADLRRFRQVRLVVNKDSTAGNTGAKVYLAYATASPFSFGSYSDIGISQVGVTIDVTNQILDSGWVNLASGAKADVYITLAGSGGDGVKSPAFGHIEAQFR